MDSVATDRVEPANETGGSELTNGTVSDTSESSSLNLNSNTITTDNNTNPHDALQQNETVFPGSENPENLVLDSVHHSEVQSGDSDIVQPTSDSSIELKATTESNSNLNQNETVQSRSDQQSEAVVKISKPLCANYRSDSSSESVDSESDSSTSTDSSTTSDSEDESDNSQDSGSNKTRNKNEEKKSKTDLSFDDLPPIESLKISVPEDACVEVGVVTSIVDTLVVVESFKGSAALDVDTILFLDCGKKTLGRVFDILGPITEPVYAVRFNNKEEIKNLNVEKNMKVYYAPKTQHTNFVFMSEVLKHKGSDASWKDNIEAPAEFQDFSDDEEERLHKNKQSREPDDGNPSDQTKSRKRSFNKTKPGTFQGNRFRNPNFVQQRANFPRRPSFVPPRAGFPNPVQAPPFPYNVPPFPQHLYYPPRFSGPPFPTFVNHGQNYQQPFYQQRTHGFSQIFGGWGRPMFRPPPPPPPPPADQGVRQPTETQK